MAILPLVACDEGPTTADVEAACRQQNIENGRDIELCVLAHRDDIRWDRIPGSPEEAPEYEVTCQHPKVCHTAFRAICKHANYKVVSHDREDENSLVVAGVGRATMVAQAQESHFAFLIRCEP